MLPLRSILLLCVASYYASNVLAESESKYNEIIKMLSTSQELKPEAQTYTATVINPSDYPSQGYARSASERSRYTASSSNYNDKEEDDAKKVSEEEDEKKPDRLALLLAESKFTCENLKNGYYADESVGCQVFHYCVDGVKHSWQCPENTVFHQIHLNCVPNTQDICTQSSKFHIVNDYLHKELDERGPNNTVLYHQRFYPEGFDIGGGDTVTQIFQAQAQARLNKANQPESNDYSSYEEEPVSRPRSRPKSYNYNSPSTQSVRSQGLSKPLYSKPVSRPVIVPSTYSPSSQSVPTKRPLSYSTPEAFTPPSYTESTQDDYSNDYSAPSSSSSSSSSGSSQNYPSSSISSSYNSGVSSYSPPSSYTPSNHGSSYRSSTSSRNPNYNTRSLGIPIASFRVAPASGYTSNSAPTQSASTIQEINVAPLLKMPEALTSNQLLRYFY